MQGEQMPGRASATPNGCREVATGMQAVRGGEHHRLQGAGCSKAVPTGRGWAAGPGFHRCGADAQADNSSRPLRRRPARMARPARVRMRSRKPWVFARRRLFGWKVRLLTTGLHGFG